MMLTRYLQLVHLVSMAQIFISAAHGGYENGTLDPGAVLPNTTEAAEMIQIRDLVVAELRSRGLNVLSVPDDLSADQTLNWINSRCRSDDVALEIQAGFYGEPSVRGATVYYISKNEARRTQAELVMIALLRRVPQLPSRGVKPDTESATGSLPFTRSIHCASLLMEVGYLSNPSDLAIIQNQRRDVALGIADGLASWSRAVGSSGAGSGGTTYPQISIAVNGGIYAEPGILVNDNSYVPLDLVEQFNLDLSQVDDIKRVNYGNVVYVKAIDLRNYNISVGWNAENRTVILKTTIALPICPGIIDSIMGHGNTSEVQLMMFLKSNNEAAVAKYSDLPRLYREEGVKEGVNYDIAFSQMMVETNNLNFGNGINPAQNNFGGLGSATGGSESASFPSARIGVRAQIQHLKAYASTEPLVEQVVDPRFSVVRRGIAPLVGQLSGRWNADSQYGDKLMAVLRRLYESAGLL